MAEPGNLVLDHLRHMHGQLDRIENRLDDLTTRAGPIRRAVPQIHVTLAKHSIRFDRVGTRMTRIEKRLDLVEG